MLKYLPELTKVSQRIPNETVLSIYITGCTHRCVDCKSKELWKDIGTELTIKEIERLLKEHKDTTCLCFMGEGDIRNIRGLNARAKYLKTHYPYLKICWYSGRLCFPNDFAFEYFDYVKLGPYMKEHGPLSSPKTNQSMFQITHNKNQNIISDITYLFWKKKD